MEAVKSEIEASQLADGIRNEVEFGLKTALDLLDAEECPRPEIRLVGGARTFDCRTVLSAAVGTLTLNWVLGTCIMI